MTADWRRLVDRVQAVPEKVYENYVPGTGYDNHTIFGQEYGWDGVAWCVEFDWCMYHDVGLDRIVPKTASVSEFASWAQSRGQWSQYPSIGAWVDFGGGAHTEIVVGFDAQNVYTKGGNSKQAGGDGGQGNGVWSHTYARTSTYITGYFAPHFPDGVCPPTADPHDPRGGTAVESWRWSAVDPQPAPAPVPAPTPQYQPYPGAGFFVSGRRSPIIAAMHDRLVAVGCSRYQSSTGKDVWGSGDVASYAAWQRKCGYSGSDANGTPGPTTWAKLQVSKVV